MNERFIGRFAANHAPLGNGRLLAMIQQYQGGHPVDRVHRILYPTYGRDCSMLGEAGIHTVVRHIGKEVRYDFYQGDSHIVEGYITVDDTNYIDGTGMYQVLSHRGHIAVRSATWIPRKVDALVRRIETTSLGRESCETEVLPQAHLIGECSRSDGFVISKVINHDQPFYLAICCPGACELHWGDHTDALAGCWNGDVGAPVYGSLAVPSFDVSNSFLDEELMMFAARYGRRPNLTFRCPVRSDKNGWSEPAYLVIGLGQSEQEALDNCRTVTNSPDCLYSDTYDEWISWLSCGKSIKDNSAQRVFSTSNSLLRMCVQDNGLPTIIGYWRYQGAVWIRDSVWVAIALTLSGHTKDARVLLDGLRRVVKKREDGNFAFAYDCWTGDAIAFTTENDSTGLLLAGLWYYYDATGDRGFLRDFWPLVSYSAEWISTNRDSCGMLPACAGPWEDFCPRRGREYEHMVWTSGVSAYGLQCAARMAADLGMAEEADTYAQAGDEILDAIREHAVKDGVVCRSLETDHLDASVLTFFSWMPLFDADDPVVAATVAAIEERLVDRNLGGVWRHEESIVDMGDNIPWPGCTLWLAEAYMKLGKPDDARRHLQWCLDNSSNCGLLPEGVVMHGVALGYAMPSWSQGGLIVALLRMQMAGYDQE